MGYLAISAAREPRQAGPQVARALEGGLMLAIDGSFIGSAIENAGRAFLSDELAYLALTSKVERPFFDRLSFGIHRQFAQELVSCREWRIPGGGSRADLCLIQIDGAPTVVVEGKAMYSFDTTRHGRARREYASAMQRDLDRYAESELGDTAIYCLLLCTHPHSRVPSELEAVVKYSAGINTAFSRFDCQETVRQQAINGLFETVESGHLAGEGEFEGGAAFGIRVDLLWWLFGPFGKSTNLRIAAV